jgi:opacity protein-like surface antigen
MTRKLLAALAASFVLTTAAAVSAQDTKASSSKPFFGLDAGVKGGVGGNYLSDPDDVPLGALVYDDGAGGVGGGGGLYAEFRILWGHLGLELDVLFEANKNWSNIEFNNVVKTDWIYRFSTVRVPLLLEGSVENDLVRGSLGIGPEFVVGTKASTDIEVTEGAQYVDEPTMTAARANFRAKEQTDTFLCIGVGLAFKVWRLAISLDIRYAYNAGMSFTGTGADTVTTAIASSTMDLRLLLGIAYEAKFGNF